MIALWIESRDNGSHWFEDIFFCCACALETNCSRGVKSPFDSGVL
jgi:hypothetical protein